MRSILTASDAGRPAQAAGRTLLEIERLSVAFRTAEGEVTAVRDFSLTVAEGECVGIVGESGAGKSQALLAVMGLASANARIGGSARFVAVDLLGLRRADLDRVRGSRMAMIFQDPMTSLTPHVRIGDQIAEVLVTHRGESWKSARSRAFELLDRVRVPDARQRMRQYPHELSGGMRQRVMIAIAIACDPALLIADEPTTALDATVQLQILALLEELKRERAMSIVLVTHDLGVVASIADRVAVMYAGRLMEVGSVASILKTPNHPYTQALLASMPRIDERRSAALPVIDGQPPDAHALPDGCSFHPRCARAQTTCRTISPELTWRGAGALACHYPSCGGQPAPGTAG